MQSVTEEVEAKYGEHDGDAREDDQVRRAEDAVLFLTHHQEPLRGVGTATQLIQDSISKSRHRHKRYTYNSAGFYR